MASVKTTVIKGTGGADTLTGTGAAETINALNGNDIINAKGGNDTVDGGSGTDTAIFSGSVDNYALQWLPDGSLQVVGADGTDKLLNVEMA